MVSGFAVFWQLYPRKVAKKAAEKAYGKAHKSFSHESIMASLDVALWDWRGRSTEFIPHPATWLNREAFEERTEALEDERELPLFEAGSHYCDVCRPPHVWKHECDLINCGGRDQTCPEERLRMLRLVRR